MRCRLALDTLNENGVTERQILLARGQDVPHVHVPIAAEHLVEWFWRLSQQRGRGEVSQPITFESIEAWSRLSGNRVAPHELVLLQDMDAAFRAGPLLPTLEADKPKRAALSPDNFDELFG